MHKYNQGYLSIIMISSNTCIQMHHTAAQYSIIYAAKNKEIEPLSRFVYKHSYRKHIRTHVTFT